MGISRHIFATVLACCALGSLQATNEAPRHQKKHYLDEQAISVTKDGIVVKTKNGQVRLKTLRSNSNGIYVYKQDLCSVVAKGEVVCDWCGRWFPNRGAYCRHLPCPNY